MSHEKEKPFKQKLFEAFIVLLMGSFAVLFVNILLNVSNRYFGSSDRDKSAETITGPQGTPPPVSPYVYKDTLKKTDIVLNYKNSSETGNEPDVNFQKNIVVKGKIAAGFLYVKADVNDTALTSYDGVYMKLSGSLNGVHTELGGHLIANRSLDVPLSNSYTEMLFPLSAVSYKKSYSNDDVEIITGDWINLLNDGTHENILGFSSTARSGNLEQVSIYYSCTDGSDCSVSVE